jgi:nitroimidazol reductase NimA-like FMN-containing flavoprotein (pyridoxamine 5'-phosphate oxidase superfamily)
MPDPAPSPRVRVKRHADRADYDLTTIHAILDGAVVCHLGVVQGGEPLVLPTGFGRHGDTLYLHGAAANAALAAAADAPVCVTVTLIDGLVLARTVFNHSMNYRSVVVRGIARAVLDDAEKLVALRAITEQIVPGRWAEVGEPTAAEVRSTRVVAVDLREASAKIRRGPSIDDADAPPELWAGVVPLRPVAGTPEPATDNRDGGAAPPSVASLLDRYR